MSFEPIDIEEQVAKVRAHLEAAGTPESIIITMIEATRSTYKWVNDCAQMNVPDTLTMSDMDTYAAHGLTREEFVNRMLTRPSAALPTRESITDENRAAWAETLGVPAEHVETFLFGLPPMEKE